MFLCYSANNQILLTFLNFHQTFDFVFEWSTVETVEPQRYHPLQGIDEVLQVDVVSVCFDVCHEEFIDPRSDLTLKNNSQHGCRQLQEEDEADNAWKLTGKHGKMMFTARRV